jgi:hypothetical protein
MFAAKAKSRVYGYTRVRSVNQDLAIQREMLQTAGCLVIPGEKTSAHQPEGSDGVADAVQFLGTVTRRRSHLVPL